MNGDAAFVPAELVARLKRSPRYVALIAEQLDAARHCDWQRLEDLKKESAEMEELFATGEDTGEDSGDDLPDIYEDMHEDLVRGLEALQEQETEERQASELWTSLRNGAVRTARSVPSRGVSRTRYPQYNPRSCELDLRF